MLALQKMRHRNGEKRLMGYDMIRLLTPLKQQPEYEWLHSISTSSLQRVCQDLDVAYRKAFESNNGLPHFKKKKIAKQSYPVCCNRFYFTDGFVQIQMLGKVKYKSDYSFANSIEHKYLNVRITYENQRYMLSFSVESENQAVELNDYAMGIDLGIKELAVVAYGENQLVFHNINKSKRIKDIDRRIKFYQRSIARKHEESKKKYGRYLSTNNIEREKRKLKKLCAKKSNIK